MFRECQCAVSYAPWQMDGAKSLQFENHLHTEKMQINLESLKVKPEPA